MPILKLRKVLSFNTLLGLTLPGEYTDALGLSKGDYAEVHLQDRETIIVKRHKTPMQKITDDPAKDAKKLVNQYHDTP